MPPPTDTRGPGREDPAAGRTLAEVAEAVRDLARSAADFDDRGGGAADRLADLSGRLRDFEARVGATARDLGSAAGAWDGFRRGWSQFRSAVGQGLRELQQGALLGAVGFNQFSQLTGAVQSQIGSLVQLYDPSAYRRFQRAVEDSQAALGSVLVPVLERFREVVRGVGGVFVSLTPAGKALVAGLAAASAGMVVMTGVAFAFSTAVNSATFGLSALAGLVTGAFAGMAFALKDTAGIADVVGRLSGQFARLLNALGEALVPLVQALMPAVDAMLESLTDSVGILAEVIREAAPAVYLVAQGMAELVRWAAEAHRAFLALLGITPRPARAADPTGMAVRNTQIGGVQEALNRAYTNAFGAGRPAPQNETLDVAKEARELLKAIGKNIEEIRNRVIAFVEGARGGAQDLADRARGAAGAAAGVVGGAVFPPAAIAAALDRIITGSITGK